MAQCGGGPGKELQIDGRVDLLPTHSPDGGDQPLRQSSRAARRNRHHVRSGNKVQQVENKAVFLEHQEKDVFSAHKLNGPANRGIGQDSRTLLGEFDQDDPFGLLRPASPAADDPAVEGHNNRAERQIRPNVIFRKLTFGNSSVQGSLNHSMFMSVIQTAKLNHKSPPEALSALWTLPKDNLSLDFLGL